MVAKAAPKTRDQQQAAWAGGLHKTVSRNGFNMFQRRDAVITAVLPVSEKIQTITQDAIPGV